MTRKPRVKIPLGQQSFLIFTMSTQIPKEKDTYPLKLTTYLLISEKRKITLGVASFLSLRNSGWAVAPHTSGLLPTCSHVFCLSGGVSSFPSHGTNTTTNFPSKHVFQIGLYDCFYCISEALWLLHMLLPAFLTLPFSHHSLSPSHFPTTVLHLHQPTTVWYSGVCFWTLH